MLSQLRRLLEEEAGWEEFQMIIPHPFLPPRFRSLAKDRNMVLLLDRDMILHIRWEGSRLHEYHPLSPRAAGRLLGEVLRRMSSYRKELQIFSRFVRLKGAPPFEDPRALDPIRVRKRESSFAVRGEEEESNEEILEAHLGATLEERTGDYGGGESPMPTMEETYERSE